ncbi:MAG: OsmC family protein [Bdellovibrionaceae bacterium]|nr:OsmC family protein [Pseudobdellovibrionaceae bacterium]MBX3034525.1 OsmC family protein [Pseudobdellovibrionaceae bacterium]
MVQMNIVYQGDKHCELTHGPSGARIETDAPKDNNGRGEAFSPTDLCAVSLASCKLTVMAIAAEKEGVDLKGSRAVVSKEMAANPRRIGRLGVELHLPARLTPEWRKKLEEVARHCPVRLSLHPDVKVDAVFHYDL